VQASFLTPPDEAEVVQALRQVLDRRPEVTVLGVPLGPCHGDVERLERMAEQLGDRAGVASAGTVDGLLAALAGADAFMGSSLHGNLLSARAGVPSAVLALGGRRPHKLTEMAARYGRPVVQSPSDVAGAAEDLLDGRLPVAEERVEVAAAEVEAHYDRLFAAIRGGVPAPREPALAADDTVDRAFEEAVAHRLDAFGRDLVAAIAYGQEAKAAYDRAHAHAEALDRSRRALEEMVARRAPWSRRAGK
jgi:hypothetical protein